MIGVRDSSKRLGQLKAKHRYGIFAGRIMITSTTEEVHMVWCKMGRIELSIGIAC